MKKKWIQGKGNASHVPSQQQPYHSNNFKCVLVVLFSISHSLYTEDNERISQTKKKKSCTLCSIYSFIRYICFNWNHLESRYMFTLLNFLRCTKSKMKWFKYRTIKGRFQSKIGHSVMETTDCLTERSMQIEEIFFYKLCQYIALSVSISMNLSNV